MEHVRAIEICDSEANKGDNTKLSFTAQEIAFFLPIYKPDSILISKAIIKGSRCKLFSRKFIYPYTTISLDYLPAPYATLILCQAGYINGAGAILSNLIPELDIDKYIKLMMSEQIVITDLNMKFRKFIPNRDNIEMSSSISRIKSCKDVILFSLNLEVSKSFKASGQLLVNLTGRIKHNFQ